MAETPAVQCPSCGSDKVVLVSLWLIPARYYECRGCNLTFRRSEPGQDSPDIGRFNEGWTVPADDDTKK